MSKKKDDKIPRDHYVIGRGNDELVSHLTITYDPITGIPSIAGLDPNSFRSVISHAREINADGKYREDKVITSSPTYGFDALGESYFSELQKKYDYLIAVDTNTEKKRIGGYKVSACFISCVAEHLSSLDEEIPYHHLACYLILDSGDEGNAERLGWHLAATGHASTPFLRTQRVGMVVDSELGDHMAINARTKPYYAEHLLPDHLSLLYASADKIETITNEMMKMNEKNSAHFIKAIKTMGISKLPLRGGIKLGTATCYLIKSNKS